MKIERVSEINPEIQREHLTTGESEKLRVERAKKKRACSSSTPNVFAFS